MKNLVERIMDYSEKNPYGFTLNIETFRPVRKGISVAFLETQNSFGKHNLEKVILHALKNNKTIGGWLNSKNGLFYFDSVKIFKKSEFNQAIEFAKQNQQIAIYDLINLKEIKIK